MPVDKQVQLGCEVLNKYFRDLYRDYTIDDLVDACNNAMLFCSDSSSVVSFQSNPDIKNISLFGDLLQAILNKKVLKLTYAPFGKDSFVDCVYPYHLKQFNDRWYLIVQASLRTMMKKEISAMSYKYPNDAESLHS